MPTPFVPIPNTIRVVVRYMENGRIRESVFHCKNGGGAVTPTDVGNAATAVDSWVEASAQSIQSQELQYLDTTATAIDVAFGYQLTIAGASPDPGHVASDTLPGNVTVAVSHRTNQTGRRYRGRTFWPGLWQTSVNTDDRIVASVASGLLGSFIALRGVLTGNALTFCIATRTVHTCTPVIAEVVDTILDSMRRRLPGRGI